MLINGVLSNQLNAYDRGLQYGDGVFRTLRVVNGKLLHWPRHYRKLQQDCAALSLRCPDVTLLFDELHSLTKHQPEGVAKIIITRGTQQKRGYAPVAEVTPTSTTTRILSMAPAPAYPDIFYTHGVKLHLCALRLAHQPRLAGIKHLNRLENVLAAAEWNNTDIPEGLMLDFSGNVIEGTRSNLFIVHQGELRTPDLSHCGVSGVQRERVIELAAKNGVACRIEQFTLAEVLAADEVFLVNSVIGLWPVRQLLTRTWSQFILSFQIQKWLINAPD